MNRVCKTTVHNTNHSPFSAQLSSSSNRQAATRISKAKERYRFPGELEQKMRDEWKACFQNSLNNRERWIKSKYWAIVDQIWTPKIQTDQKVSLKNLGRVKTQETHLIAGGPQVNVDLIIWSDQINRIKLQVGKSHQNVKNHKKSK